ncbi:MAG: hypothetical protein NVSMB59_22700 [Vulcanimicrobiaceae bacterium]
MRFCIDQGELWRAAARDNGRTYLTWAEWDAFFVLAIDHGVITPEEIEGLAEREPMSVRSDRDALAYRSVNATVIHGLVLEKLRGVTEAKARGISPWHVSLEVDRLCTEDRSLRESKVLATSAALAAARDLALVKAEEQRKKARVRRPRDEE